MTSLSRLITAPCVTCGAPVPGVDPDRGLVIRTDVVCPTCARNEACINCRRLFADDDTKCSWRANDITVGPFCGRCTEVIEIAEDAARRAREHIRSDQ